MPALPIQIKLVRETEEAAERCKNAKVQAQEEDAESVRTDAAQLVRRESANGLSLSRARSLTDLSPEKSKCCTCSPSCLGAHSHPEISGRICLCAV